MTAPTSGSRALLNALGSLTTIVGIGCSGSGTTATQSASGSSTPSSVQQGEGGAEASAMSTSGSASSATPAASGGQSGDGAALVGGASSAGNAGAVSAGTSNDGGTSSGGAAPLANAGSGGSGLPEPGELFDFAAGTCPADLPTAGSPCEAFTACTYGDEPLATCRTAASCQDLGSGFQWQVVTPDCASDERCPSDVPTGTCDYDVVNEIVCYYPDGATCWGCSEACMDGCAVGDACNPCAEGEPNGSRRWACRAPQVPDGCPSLVPNNGAPCQQESGTVCATLRACPAGVDGSTSQEVVCIDGSWRWVSRRCPSVAVSGPGDPVCAAPDTPIATPSGDRPISSLGVGDLVYSVVDEAVVVVPIVRVNQTPVTDHRVVELVLESGETLHVSGGHPTADGQSFADLSAGDRLDTLRVEQARWVPYPYDRTYDILPDSDSGTYYAAGALIGSTLSQ